jgi:hypothetical protein
MASFRSEVPAMPASLQQQARELQERCDSGRAGTGTRRPVIIGSLFLLGAAATMFAAVPWSDTSTVNQ